MKHHSILAFAVALLLPVCAIDAQEAATPDSTLLYAQKDTSSLYLDYYAPSDKFAAVPDSLRKPTILFVFGGGFINGKRDDERNRRWFQMLTDEGYGIVAIDYRLGLKGVRTAGVNLKFVKNLDRAICLAVEDLFSATRYLIDHSEALKIDPSRLVVSGSSAGAITALQAEWEICNGSERAKALPEGFNYAGLLSFSGAILSMDGAVRYKSEPCPMLLIHGTSDSIVPYGQISLLRMHFAGSDTIAKVLAKAGFNYNILRFKGHNHEICNSMIINLPEELRFLGDNIEKGIGRIVDANIDDPGIPVPEWATKGYKDMYSRQ